MAGKERVLVVNGDPEIRESLGEHFRRDGLECGFCSSGPEALQALYRERWDLVLADIWTPGMDGLELLLAVRATYPGIPVIITSGHGSVETAVRIMRAGAYDYIQKPVDLDSLKRRVLQALAEVSVHRDEGKSLREVERAHILQTVEQAGGNLSKSARMLGIDRTTLYNKLKRYGAR